MAQIAGVHITEHGNGVRMIEGAPTSVALFVGWAPSGPTDRALRVQSFADYRLDFGLDPRSLLGYALRHFLDNGGVHACVLRIAGRDEAAVEPGDEAFLAALHAALSPGGPVDRADPFNLICVPGLTDAASIAMLQARASARGAFLIADCDKADTVASVIASLAGKTGQDARNSALYFPWVIAPDPLDNDKVRAFPPCGFVAGVLARLDTARGVWMAPAGSWANLIGASDFSVHVDDAENEQLNGRGINCLRSFADRGLLIFGARTLDGDDSRGSEWKYVSVRRLALFVEQSVSAGTQWTVFEPNGEPLWAQLRLNIGAFMLGLFRQGAFQGSTASETYFVKCDRTTTTQADIDRGVVSIVIGFAPLKPSEFVILALSQLTAASGAG